MMLYIFNFFRELDHISCHYPSITWHIYCLNKIVVGGTIMKAIRTFATISIIVVLAGCGASASAPPIDLPAPVVGRIAVSTPDATGKVTITGSEGAVTGSAIVLAINESLEASSALWKITDILIPFAYAQVLPSVCSESGHWCTVASADGSFEIIIDAAIGDSIVLVLIDQEGNERSPRVRVVVPSTNLALDGCSGMGVNGSMTDLFNAEGAGVSLYEGDDTLNNKVIFGTAAVTVPGCYAKDVEFISTGPDGGTVVALSENDKTIWVGAYAGGVFIYAQTFIMDDTPLALADIGQKDFLAIALQSSAGFFVGRLSLADGTVDNRITLPDPIITTHVLDGIIRMKSVGPFTDGGYLLGLLMTGTDVSGTVNFVHFVETTNFTIATELQEPINLAKLLTLTADIVDEALPLGDVAVTNVMMLLLDEANPSCWMLQLYKPGISVQLAGSSAASLSNATFLDIPLQHVPPLQGPIPKRLDIGISQGVTITAPVAYILVDDVNATYNLWTIPNFAQLPPPASVLNTISAATDPALISVSTPVEGIMVGDAASNSLVDADSFWYEDF